VGREAARSGELRLLAQGSATFSLLNVLIGKRFHWERPEDQTFGGSLLLRLREDGSMAVINEIPLEEYLRSVVSSEMSASAPLEFLKAHAIISRSWLLAALGKKGATKQGDKAARGVAVERGAMIRWYDREEHDLFDVCADDHCQRYQGVTKITSGRPLDAAAATRGMVLSYGRKICDARYSKACGGLTEEFATAWESVHVPYLTSVADSPEPHSPIETEAQAREWILSSPEAYCRVEDEALIKEVLPGFDRETKDFFRWTVAYSRRDLSSLVQEKSGLDLGAIRELRPLLRGPSGRIYRLKIIGSKGSVVVGKELEIRRWLSPTHLLSSAFVVDARRDRRGRVEAFTLHGAGWGHGVGFCQIGAAVMAIRGFSAGEILSHYFAGARIRRVYK
jgi:stage II sporulation protein D